MSLKIGGVTMIKSSRLFLIVLMLFALATMFGCGSSKKEPGAEAEVGINHIGFTDCYNCHADAKNPASFPPVFGDSDIGAGKEGWLNGPHGNNESYDTNTHRKYDNYPNNTGFPFYGYFSDSTCATCHDPLGDGKRISLFFTSTGINKLGTLDRPVIGCESCHGPGGNHYGLGPIPYPKPDFNRCGQCHNANFPDSHLPYHPEGDRIVEDYKNSPHAKSINSHTYVTGSTTDVRARCSRCHTDEGAKRYVEIVNGTADYDTIKTLDSYPNIINASNVQCRTCHDGHNPFRLLGEKATGLPSEWSAEFKSCTSCHQLLNAGGTLLDKGYHTPYDKNGTPVNPYGSVEEIIADTHYDDPATVDIEGYIIDPTAEHSASKGNTNRGICRDCHNPHKADNTINRQWANSGHGGFILKVKENAPNAYTAAVTENEAPAWVYYDFKSSTRQACQRCHTSTGFRNMANNPDTYNPANNVFVATGNQKELLYCWACHTSNTGNLRNPEKFVSPSTTLYLFPAGRSFPTDSSQDSYISGSIICINCHSGRQTGEYIKGRTFPYSGNFGGFNSHYLAAGGILFRTIGYEYTGRNYDNPSYFRHDQIGTKLQAGTGSNGPCVSCHMRGEANHLFSPVEKDEQTGLIKSIPANEKICSKCHTGQYALTPDKLNEEEEEYEAALDALQAALQTKGIYWCSSYPYFFSNASCSTQYTSWSDADTLGAAFNLNLLKHEPGAFTHNRFYTKRLIYDSIDFIYDSYLDNDVVEAINYLVTNGYINSTKAALALSYLNNGTRP
jgi:hypothetical protein